MRGLTYQQMSHFLDARDSKWIIESQNEFAVKKALTISNSVTTSCLLLQHLRRLEKDFAGM
jgi:hypothetical protein